MAIATLRRIDRLQSLLDGIPTEEAPDLPPPVKWAENTLGFQLDKWQKTIMQSTHNRLVVVAARQSGKSVITGAKAAFEACAHPGLRVVVVAPSFRQSRLLADKIEIALDHSGFTYSRIREKITLHNGSTVVILHGDRSATLRGHTADLLLCDELGFVKPELMPAIMPMVQASKGRMIAVSSPNGPSGPLFELANADGVELLKIPARDVAHFDQKVIDEIRGRLGDAMARQELDAEFVASSFSVFDAAALSAMFGTDDSAQLQVEETVIAAEETALAAKFRAVKSVEARERKRHAHLYSIKEQFDA